jgi:hypothetical protein
VISHEGIESNEEEHPMKRTKNAGRKSVFLILLLLLLTYCLYGCDVYGDSEDMSHQRTWGDAVEIDYEFNALDIVKRGPYELRITPVGIVELEVKGQIVDCIKIEYQLLSTNDDAPAGYADCVSVVDLLTEDFGEVAHYKWYTDRDGTEFPDVRNGTLDIGVPYTFYIPLRESLEDSGLYWITLSDRSNYHNRSGTTYWYRVAE